ncbi:DUF2887 domain-containing protein [Methylomonas sp. LL1]|nr:DUF2887 domain-containing protein [Methylomonas sp. LL1]
MRYTEKPPSIEFAPFMQLPCIQRIYLEDYRQLQSDNPAQSLLGLIACQEEQAVEFAQKLLKQRTIDDLDILNFVETVLVYKLPHLTREEIRTMLGLDTELKQTRFYQEIAEEERQEECIKMLARFLRRKFGLLPELDAALQKLSGIPLDALENLADELQDFETLEELQNWIAAQTKRANRQA